MYRRPLYMITIRNRVFHRDERALVFDNQEDAVLAFEDCLRAEKAELIAHSAIRKSKNEQWKIMKSKFEKSPVREADIFQNHFANDDVKADYDIDPEVLIAEPFDDIYYWKEEAKLKSIDFSWWHDYNENNECITVPVIVTLTAKDGYTLSCLCDTLTLRRILVETDPLDQECVDKEAVEEERTGWTDWIGERFKHAA